jgi:hypothetical protein
VWSGFQLLRFTEVARSSSYLFVVYSSAVFNTLRYSKVVCGILCELRLGKVSHCMNEDSTCGVGSERDRGYIREEYM